jgi:hypothetical protein
MFHGEVRHTCTSHSDAGPADPGTECALPAYDLETIGRLRNDPTVGSPGGAGPMGAA